MGYESNTGLGVNNHYGERVRGNAIGHIKTEGAIKELTLDITGKMINNSFRPEVVLPAGSLVVEAYADISEVFVVTGTTPTISIGTLGSEATNGVDISEAQAEAVGTVDITSTAAGTWAASLAAATTVGVGLGGTTPAVTDAGKATVVIRYVSV